IREPGIVVRGADDGVEVDLVRLHTAAALATSSSDFWLLACDFVFPSSMHDTFTSPITLIIVRQRSRNQSTGRSQKTASGGRWTALKTSVMVMRPASGIPAAPTDATTDISTRTTCWPIGRFWPITWATKSAAMAS